MTISHKPQPKFDGDTLLCPDCEFIANHVQHVYISQHYEKDEPGLISIEFDCEGCGSRWSLDLRQHKGSIVVSTEIIRKSGT